MIIANVAIYTFVFIGFTIIFASILITIFEASELNEKIPKLYKRIVKTINSKTKRKTQVEADIEEAHKDIKALEKQIEDVKNLNTLNKKKEELFMKLERYENENK